MKKEQKFTKTPRSISTHQFKISNKFSTTPMNEQSTITPCQSTQTLFKRQCNHSYFSPQIQCEKLIERYFYAQHISKKQTIFNRNLGKIIFRNQKYYQIKEKKPMLRIASNNTLLLSTMKKRDSSEIKRESQVEYGNYNLKQLKNKIFNIDDHNYRLKLNSNSISNKYTKPILKLNQRSVYSIKTLINQDQTKLLQESFFQKKILKNKESAALSPNNKLSSKLNINYVSDYVAKTYSSNSYNESAAYFSLDHVFGFESYQIFGVCNGIGPEKKNFPLWAKEILVDYLTSSTFWLISEEISEENLVSKFNYNDCEILKKILNQVNEDFAKRNYDFENNGTTLAILFIIGRRVISMNIGNDKIILLKKAVDKEGDDYSQICILTEDHSIKNINEQMRIRDNLVLFNEFETTRALGLNKYVESGLSREPYIRFDTMDKDWNTIVIGTKKVWDNCLNYNIFKVFFSSDEDLIVKMNKVLQFKRRHLEGLIQNDFSFSIIIISF